MANGTCYGNLPTSFRNTVPYVAGRAFVKAMRFPLPESFLQPPEPTRRFLAQPHVRVVFLPPPRYVFREYTKNIQKKQEQRERIQHSPPNEHGNNNRGYRH